MDHTIRPGLITRSFLAIKGAFNRERGELPRFCGFAKWSGNKEQTQEDVQKDGEGCDD